MKKSIVCFIVILVVALSFVLPKIAHAASAINDILPVGARSLPIDNTIGKRPAGANFSENGYQDDTIIVRMDRQRMYNSDVFIAHVKIANASQLRTAYAGKSISSTRTNQTSRLSEKFNAVVAINGDYYSKTKSGYIVRQGEVYRRKTSDNMDLLLVDELGNFHILLRGHNEQTAAIETFLIDHQIINGFFFGPALVVNGEVQDIPKNYRFDPHSKNPRAAIGQTGPLSYVMVVVNGRSTTSAGISIAELAEIMNDLQCWQAYNLDGGNSATLAFNGEVYSSKPQAERDINDIIYFASAAD